MVVSTTWFLLFSIISSFVNLFVIGSFCDWLENLMAFLGQTYPGGLV